MRRYVAAMVTVAMTAVIIAAVGSTSARAATSALLISEYVEGSSTNKAVEIYNPSEAAVDLAGYSLQVYFNGSSSAGTTIQLTGSVAAKGTHVVADDLLAEYAQQTTGASLWNGDDTILLSQGSVVVDSFGQLGVDPGSSWGNGATANHTLRRLPSVCTGDTNPNDAFDPTAQWEVLPQDTFDGLGEHTTECSGTPSPTPTSSPTGSPTTSPSTPVEMTCGADATAIGAIQGEGAASPMVQQTVVTEGVVVGDFQVGGFNGYYVQDAGDDNPATSDGIFVFAQGGAEVAAGDVLRIRGEVSEYYGMTELTVEELVACGTAELPAATPITLPMSETERESLEGMRVTMTQTMHILEYYNYGRYGEIAIGTSRQHQPTAVADPGSPEALAVAAANAANRITLDDGRSWQNPDPALHPGGGEFGLTNFFRGGDTLNGVTGVLDYRFDLWRIQPTQPAEHTPANERPAVPQVGGDVQVASFNVLNYFTTLGSRGADTPEELERQQAKIVAAINEMDADIVGLLEIENNDDVALNTLVAALNEAAGSTKWTALETGKLGTDEITTAFIYQRSSVHPVGKFAVLDGTVDERFNTMKNRPALAQTFGVRGTGSRVTVAVNHLKSKGSDCNDVGDPEDPNGQGNCNGTRTVAAEALADWLEGNPTRTGSGRNLIIGDLNAYDHEDPITALTKAGYTDLIKKFQGAEAYSYVFDGQLGYLDHGLANAALANEVTGAAVWHINADETSLLDYDMTFKADAQDAIFAPNAFRSSDHDAVLIGLSMNPGRARR
ncbi:ExeM/NucH family extracellular endonuclease [Microlunatus sp. Y2014]|uniref:ExeM/NucH family extracellular endonuclease n=1 Tax=Microlunatus sp. Y2014 TaxID=3418488 RepID=UPI003DA78DC6